MTLVDSVAAFEARCNEIDDTGQLSITLTRQGINTFSSMAFALGTPNQPPTEAVFDTFATRLFVTPSMGQIGKLCRILFESQTYVLAQLKLAVTGDQTAGSKKLPLPEKQARLADIKTRLNGVVLEGEKEPSHSLIDLCQTIRDREHHLDPSFEVQEEGQRSSGLSQRPKASFESGVTDDQIGTRISYRRS